jgi:hypothetical protein
VAVKALRRVVQAWLVVKAGRPGGLVVMAGCRGGLVVKAGRPAGSASW